jgi:hypothetical protein
LPSSPHWEPTTTTFAMRNRPHNSRNMLVLSDYSPQPFRITDDAPLSKAKRPLNGASVALKPLTYL